MKETFRCEYVRCGRSGCKTCPHGPYWYAYRKVRGKVKKRYCGKLDPRPVVPKVDPRMERWRAIFNGATCSSTLAAEILGVFWRASEAEFRMAYRKRAMETHPDLNGSVEESQAVNAAWVYLCAVNNWRR